jgi:hypothetical protein
VCATRAKHLKNILHLCDKTTFITKQRAVKVTAQQPQSLRGNLARLYEGAPDVPSGSASAPYQKLRFGLSWLHAVLLSRRRFGSLGFATRYDFTDADFSLADDVLRSQMLASGNVAAKFSVEALRYFIGEAVYGGRVTNPNDRLILDVYAKRCVGWMRCLCRIHIISNSINQNVHKFISLHSFNPCTASCATRC